MQTLQTIWARPADYLAAHHGDHPVLFFSPETLQRTAARFQKGFPGLVSYAVKANPDALVLDNLGAAGISAFDVASVPEIETIAQRMPGAAMHYNNPVRSGAEVARAVELGVRSFAVDSLSELEKLRARVPQGTEVSVRYHMDLGGAAYDFGTKFGADFDGAVALLLAVQGFGLRPSLTFHPGTQCTDPKAWAGYIAQAGRIARAADADLFRLNVGGGFPARRRRREDHDLEEIFGAISDAQSQAFPGRRPHLVCEPGRGMVADCMSVAARVRAVRDGADVFLSDGIYGGFAEAPVMGTTTRLEVFDAQGRPRQGPVRPRTVFGPTCDSLDRLPGSLDLPLDIAEGDFVLFHGMGAYSTVTATRFNGFGSWDVATVRTLSA